jgi:hypothetical protein
MYRGANLEVNERNRLLLQLCSVASVDDLKRKIDECYINRRKYYVGEALEQRCHDRRNQHIQDPKELFEGKMYYTLVEDRFQREKDLIKYGKDKDEKEKTKLCLNKKKSNIPKDVCTIGQVYVVVLCEQWI